MGDIDAVFSEKHADRLQIEQFVQALFRYADSESYVSLRAFDQQDSTQPAFLIQPVQVGNGNGKADLAHIVTEATAAAERCLQAPRSIVFAPPICTFNNALRGRTQDLANGLALSIELDEGNTLAALERLTALIGQPTEVVASGSDWMDPATGELFPKLHIHWRLSEPTRTEADHATLARVRDLAARLAGADPTGKPVVHPLRWPGSWNRKGEAAGREPRLARILSGLGNPDAEIHLVEVAEIVAEAVESAGINEPGDGKDLPVSSTPEANEALLADAFATIPNPGRTVHYDEWMRFGYAAYRAFGGSEAGREAWDAWAQKSEKYDAREQDAAWRRIGNAIRGGTAVRTVGAGTIFFHATAAGWVRPALRLFEARQGDPAEESDLPSPKSPQWPAEDFTAASLNALEPYDWVYKRFLVTRYFSVLGAPPGTGKSALIVIVAISIATGRPLLGGEAPERRKVWIINLEDPREAILKMIWACCQHYNIEPVTLEGWIFVNSGRDRPLTMAVVVEGAVMRLPIVDVVQAECLEKQIEVLFVDPVVDTHKVPENDNMMMNDYCAIWNQLADSCRMAVCLSMHFRKGGQGGDPDSFRGATAVIAKARVANTLAVMTQEAARSLGIPEEFRRYYLQLENAKRNLSPPPTKAEWLRLESVPLVIGDNIQTLSEWSPPSAWEGLSMADIVQIMEKIEVGPEPGEFYTGTKRGRKNDRWVGNLLVEAGKSPASASEVINQWLKSGLLLEGVYHSPKTRKEIPCVRVDATKLAEMRASQAPISSSGEDC